MISKQFIEHKEHCPSLERAKNGLQVSPYILYNRILLNSNGEQKEPFDTWWQVAVCLDTTCPGKSIAKMNDILEHFK